MTRSSVRFLLGLLALLGAPSAGQATPFLRSDSSACFSSVCEFAPIIFGKGAATDILRTFPGAGVLFQGEAAMTVFDYDGFSARARASGDAHIMVGTPGIGGVSSTGTARAILDDVVTVAGPAGSGIFRLTWHLTGVTDLGWTTTDPLQTGPLSEVQVGFLCGVFGGGDCDDALFRYHANTTVDETVSFDIPIVFNAPKEYQFQIVVSASTGTGNLLTAGELAFAGHALGNFLSTGTLVDVAVFDAAGNPVDESGIMAESLFRYDLVGSVPEPGALALGLLAALAVRGRPRRHPRA